MLVIALLQTFFIGGLLFTYVSLKIPRLTNVANYKPNQATIIYDRYGQIVDRVFVENRTVVPLAKMAKHLPQAFVAAEDGRFFEHKGLDFFSVLRAFLNNVRSGARSQGGSTITQQVAKSLLLTPEKTYIRKFKEAVLAWRIDTLLRKEEILMVYLNQIYLGEGAYGVQAAAQVYFGKNAAALSLGECALLAGLPQAPSRYSLFDHLDRAVERQKYVLNRMAADGYVTREEAQAAFKESVRLNKNIQQADDSNGYYLELVKRQARELLQEPLQVAGATIYTNLDPLFQRTGTEAIRGGIESTFNSQQKKDANSQAIPQGALVCLECGSGRVRALVGGRSFTESPFDRASQARRQAGSTFKPFVFAAALRKGWQPGSPINDNPLAIGNWHPKNYGNRYYGQTTLTEALTYSLNSATIRLMQNVGYKSVQKLAKEAGVRAKMPNDLSLALGSVDVRLLEMTAAFAIFTADGRNRGERLVEKVVTADGRTLSPPATSAGPVLDGQTRKQMQGMLQRVVRVGTAKALADLPGVLGGKTGTTDDSRDAWFIGYTNRHVTGVWVGNDDNSPLPGRASGGTVAVPIWREFMEQVEK